MVRNTTRLSFQPNNYRGVALDNAFVTDSLMFRSGLSRIHRLGLLDPNPDRRINSNKD